MMRKIYPYSLTLVILVLCTVANAQFKDSKEFRKAVKVSTNGKLTVTNRHGNINLVSWDKDSVVVYATIKGQSKSLAKLKESMEMTSINFRKSGSSIELSSVFSKTSFSTGIDDILSSAGVSNEMSINYEIKLPRSLRLSVINKYGDVYIDQHSGVVQIELSHGNLRANTLKEVDNLRASFGDVYIDRVDVLNGDLQFSHIEIEDAQEINVTSKSTKFEIESVHSFQLNSSNDKVDLDEVAAFSFVGSLSKINIGTLSNSASLSLKYGRVRIKTIEKGVCSFSASTTRSTLDLGFEKGSNASITGFSADCEVQSINPNIVVESAQPSLAVSIGNKQASSCKFSFTCQKGKIFFK